MENIKANKLHNKANIVTDPEFGFKVEGTANNPRILSQPWDSLKMINKRKAMKYFVYIFFSTILFSNTSCKNEDWFDVKSSQQMTVPSNLSDLQALLDNAQLFNAWCPRMGENASDYHYYRDAIIPRLPGPERNSYIWTNELPYRLVTDWINGGLGSYSKIYTANLILEISEKLSNKSDDEIQGMKGIRGEALFFRGKAFFELAEIFVPPYNQGNEKQKFGLPLRLKSDITAESVRSTIGETYQRICTDLLASIELLPLNQKFPTRPTKSAAYAMLARVYLSLGNYKEALKYSDLCLEIHNSLINYNTINTNVSTNPFIGYNTEIIHYSYMNGSIFTMTNINIDRLFYNSFNDKDLRKFAYFNYNQANGLVTYKGTYSGLGYNFFFNGLATDEQYLIRAECYARENNVIKAMKDLNTLLKTRWLGSYTDLTASNAEDALSIILRERKKELVLRGVRWSDLRRLNQDSRFAQTFTRVVGGKTYTLEPNSYKYTFPLPDDILEMTAMQQNEGWK